MVSRSAGISMAQSCAQAQGWVRDNYERHSDGVVAKSVIYKHYEDFCRDQGRSLMETSIFGRVVKQVFPDVNIRRLGGRDNLKYYYCGIQAQLSSPYVSDNTNTTRPKRKQRKRDIIADKMEASNCLRWLHSHYAEDADGTVAKSDLYSHYSQYTSATNGGEPLSLQQFNLVVMNAFTRISKRKIGPKSPQQNVFVGISPRPMPIDPNTIPMNYYTIFESSAANSKLDIYREGSNTPDDEDDYNCRSPESEEGSDMSAGNSENSCSELKSETECLPQENYSYYPVKNEPEDYSLSTLRLKDEPIDARMAVVKEEKLSDCFMNEAPERPLSNMMESPVPSPSPPPQKATKNRIYKPRFHINYHDRDWDRESDIKLEQDQCLMGNFQSQCDYVLKSWLMERLERCKSVWVNRDQVYSHYERHCELTHNEVLPLAHFDKIVLKTYPDTATMMHSAANTFYEGVTVRPDSDLHGRVQELIPDHTEVSRSWDSHQQASFEMSSPPGDSSSPITLDDDEEEEDNLDDAFSTDRYRDTPDDDSTSIPEVLRDGKYYLKNWLMDNFESVPEACVLKADAYRHYELYAKSVFQNPFEMNVFGKIVRQVFPKVSIRRLGGRQKPQYHYCGITAKPTSPLYSHLSGKDPAQRSRKKEIATDNRTAELVIDWLRKNYDPAKDRIITKGDVFYNYSAYCKSLGENPISVNYFGKLVKHCFPNVEVRKFGGRAEPNWFYYGLYPKDPSQQSMFLEEFGESHINQYSNSPGHHNNQAHQHSHHHLVTSPPIAVPGGGGVYASGNALDSPYSGSPQVLVSSSISQQYIQTQLLRQQQQSPFSSSSSIEPRSGLSLEMYSGSPGLSRRFKEGLMPHGSMEGGHMLVNTPYEPDVAPENIFPRNPEDSSAQTCRSPAAALHQADSSHHMSPAYLSQERMLSSSPNSKRGAQVVPSQTPPSYHVSSSLSHHPHHHLHHSADASLSGHKRVKHQVAPEDYNSLFSGRS